MVYTKSDLQLSDASLFHAVCEIGKKLEKTNPELSNKLFFNFNTYNEHQLTDMLNRFKYFLVNSIDCPLGVLNVDYITKNNQSTLKELITNGLCEENLPKPVLKRSTTA